MENIILFLIFMREVMAHSTFRKYKLYSRSYCERFNQIFDIIMFHLSVLLDRLKPHPSKINHKFTFICKCNTHTSKSDGFNQVPTYIFSFFNNPLQSDVLHNKEEKRKKSLLQIHHNLNGEENNHE